MNYPIERKIILYVDSLSLVKDALLYGLCVSHGIRIDTIIYLIYSDRNVYIFNGEKLRHLYPHKKSLEGFIYSVFIKHKYPPGVSITSIEIVKKDCLENDLIVLDNIVKPTYNALIYNISSVIYPSRIIISTWKTLSYITGYIDNVFIIRENILANYIVKTHYLLDTIYGGWIRRYGRIEYREPL